VGRKSGCVKTNDPSRGRHPSPVFKNGIAGRKTLLRKEIQHGVKRNQPKVWSFQKASALILGVRFVGGGGDGGEGWDFGQTQPYIKAKGKKRPRSCRRTKGDLGEHILNGILIGVGTKTVNSRGRARSGEDPRKFPKPRRQPTAIGRPRRKKHHHKFVKGESKLAGCRKTRGPSKKKEDGQDGSTEKGLSGGKCTLR